MTIADPAAMAYFVIGEIRGLEGFPGLARDGEVPAGDRIFRLPYLDPDGRMTVAQSYTASFGPDYRLAPLAARNESRGRLRRPHDSPRGEDSLGCQTRSAAVAAQLSALPRSGNR